MALIDRDAERRLAEQDTENLIRSRGPASDQEIANSASATAGSRGRFASSIPALAESIGARTGLADSGAGAAAVAPFAEDLKRTDDEANSLRKVREKRDNVNQLFSFMSDRLQAAGIDRSKAEDVARQFALDEDQRANISSENERSRDLAVKKQDLLDSYADKQIELKRKAEQEQQKNAFKQAIYKSLFGMAGTAVGAYTGGLGGKAAAAAAGGAGASTAASEFGGSAAV